MKENQVQIAILGFGTVGSGTAQVLCDNRETIQNRIGRNFDVKAILDLREFPDSPFASRITHDFNTILNDPEICVVAEAMGGSHPAYEFTKALLEAGKNVVTSNKEVVANFGAELLAIAKAHRVAYVFEAAVGGGIPIIRPLTRDLCANNILSVCGILNGTTNYILTQMKENGTSFADALAQAQKLGYAEANPTADVEGLDAARKICILCALAFDTVIPVDKVYAEGITKINDTDTKIASLFGYAVKLIGYTAKQDGKIVCMVSPRLVPAASTLYGVSDVFNAVAVNCDMLGTATFCGRGAGKLPTASAVAGDVIDCIEHPDGMRLPVWRAADENDVLPMDAYVCRRCFAFAGDMNIVKLLPAALQNGQAYAADGIVAVFVDGLTEAQAKDVIASCPLPCISALRVL